MAKSILNFSAQAVFDSVVAIPVPGKSDFLVKMKFKYRPREEFQGWFAGLSNYDSDVDCILDIATGWDLSDPFDAETLADVDKANQRAFRAIINRYIEEHTGAKLGN